MIPILQGCCHIENNTLVCIDGQARDVEDSLQRRTVLPTLAPLGTLWLRYKYFGFCYVHCQLFGTEGLQCMLGCRLSAWQMEDCLKD